MCRTCYVPDLTERYPEGFSGVDRTASRDMWDLLELNDKMNMYNDMPEDIND